MSLKTLTTHDGIKIPAIGFGTWQTTDESELEVALNTALELGYRHIDTAWHYNNEHMIGRVLKRWFDAGKLKREDVFVTTKCPQHGINPDRIQFFIKESLKSLQLDYVDLYLLHFPIGCNVVGNNEYPPSDKFQLEMPDHVKLWKKMEEQVEAGRTRAIGLSNFSIKQIENILKQATIKPHNHQIEVHVFLQQKPLVDFCHKNGITVVGYSPLANPGYNDFLKICNQESRQLPNGLQHPVIKAIAEKHGKSTGQIMIRYLVERDIIPIPKSVKPARIKENLDVLNFSLDADDMKQIEKLDMGEKGRIVDWRVVPGLDKHPDYPFGN